MGAPMIGYYRRDLRWYFIWLPETDEMALYDVTADPGQTEDVAQENSTLIENFKADIETWRVRYE